MGGTRFLQRSALQINETRVDRDEPRGVSEEVQMELVDPVPNLRLDVVVWQGAIFFKISTYFGWKDIHIFLSGVEGYS